MATVSITYGKLETAAKQARNVAADLTEYAELIPTKVTTPLGDLTGGSTSYTTSAVSLAQQKASQMRERASAYTALASGIESFSASAREADEAVATTMSRLTSAYVGNLGFWERLVLAVTDMYNKTIGKTGLGKLLSSIRNVFSEVADLFLGAVEDAWNWFKYGDGQYLLDAVLTGVKALVGAITMLKVVAIIAATGPFGWAAACVVGIVALVAITKKFSDAFFTGMAAYEGITTNDTEPGVAAYYGSVGSLSDFFETYSTNADAQSAANTLDTAGSVASFIMGLLGLGTTSGSDTWSSSNIGSNLAKNYFGWKDGSWSFGNLFGFNGDGTSTMKGISSVLDFFQNSLELDSTDFGDIFSSLVSMFDDASGYYSFSLATQLKKLLGF